MANSDILQQALENSGLPAVVGEDKTQDPQTLQGEQATMENGQAVGINADTPSGKGNNTLHLNS